VPIKTFSVLDRLRSSVGRAEGNLKRCKYELAGAEARLATGTERQRGAFQGRVNVARLELDDAERYLAHVRGLLGAEEQRLLKPDTFLRFGSE
jgi:hypothetical protein